MPGTIGHDGTAALGLKFRSMLSSSGSCFGGRGRFLSKSAAPDLSPITLYPELPGIGAIGAGSRTTSAPGIANDPETGIWEASALPPGPDISYYRKLSGGPAWARCVPPSVALSARQWPRYFARVRTGFLFGCFRRRPRSAARIRPTISTSRARSAAQDAHVPQWAAKTVASSAPIRRKQYRSAESSGS